MLAALVLAIGAHAASRAAPAAEIRVLCPNALRTPVAESARRFARTHGPRVELIFSGLAAVQKRVAIGERADVAIATVQGAQALVGLGRGVEGSVTPLVAGALALALPRQASRPDVVDRAAIVRTLVAAQSLVLPDPTLGAPGGAQAAELLERLGIAAEVQARIDYVVDARSVARRVAAGKAEAGIAAMSDLLPGTKIRVVGPIVEPRTEGIAYAALVVRSADAPDAARAFVAHLRAPASLALFRDAGYLPLD